MEDRDTLRDSILKTMASIHWKDSGQATHKINLIMIQFIEKPHRQSNTPRDCAMVFRMEYDKPTWLQKSLRVLHEKVEHRQWYVDSVQWYSTVHHLVGLELNPQT